MTNHRCRRFLLCCVGLVFAGCASTQSVPEDHFYRLTPLAVVEPFATPPIAGVLKVDRVKAIGIYQERSLLFSREATPETLERYHYHFWVDAPAVLLRKHLVAYLRKRAVAPLVLGGETRQTGDIQLQLELHNFERILNDAGPVQVMVGLGLVAKTGRGEKPLLIKSYSTVKSVDDAAMPASIRAINQGLADIYRQLTDDLTAALVARAGD